MKKIVKILPGLCLLITSCIDEQKQENKEPVNASNQFYYTHKIMDWYSELDPMEAKEDTCSCSNFSVNILSDTIIPNYYIEYNSKKYRLDSYLYNQSAISFWYDIFDNRTKKCSFILFFGVKKNSKYSYTVIDIAETGLYTTKYYEIQGTDYKDNSLDGSEEILNKTHNDTIAIFGGVTYTVSVDEFFSKDFEFPALDTIKSSNYLLRNGNWTKQAANEEESLIMKHFVFIR